MTTHISLTTDQSLAMEKMLAFATMGRNRIFTLAGFAGVGKTTVMAAFAQEAVKSVPVALTAPTNKAVRVLRDMAANHDGMEKVRCQTIFSLMGLRLGIDGEMKRVNFDKANPTEPFTAGVIVVDEASMVGKDLFAFLETFLEQNPRVKVLFVGDPMQLPPVKENTALPFERCHDSFRLEKIIRQAEANPIIRLTVAIRKAIETGAGAMPAILTDGTGDGDGVFTMGHADFMAWIKHSFQTPEYREDPNEYRVVAWRNKTVDHYNDFIRRAVYGPALAEQRYIIGERVTSCTPIFDPVLVGQVMMRTDDEATVLNLETAVKHPTEELPCQRITMVDDTGKEVQAYVTTPGAGFDAFESRRQGLKAKALASGRYWPEYYRFVEAFADIRLAGARVDTGNIRPAHTLTAHKSQGSTFNRAFVDAVDILANNNRVEALRCLYVAASRARQAVAIRTGA